MVFHNSFLGDKKHCAPIVVVVEDYSYLVAIVNVMRLIGSSNFYNFGVVKV